MKKQKLSPDYITSSDSDSEGGEVVSKGVKKESIEGSREGAKSSKESKPTTNTNNSTTTTGDSNTFELSNKRRVTVRKFKSSVLIDIREFYEDRVSGEELPGKKGISLTIEQFAKLKECLADIDAAIEKLQ